MSKMSLQNNHYGRIIGSEKRPEGKNTDENYLECTRYYFIIFAAMAFHDSVQN